MAFQPVDPVEVAALGYKLVAKHVLGDDAVLVSTRKKRNEKYPNELKVVGGQAFPAVSEESEKFLTDGEFLEGGPGQNAAGLLCG